jgi:hypothetical protein
MVEIMTAVIALSPASLRCGSIRLPMMPITQNMPPTGIAT